MYVGEEGGGPGAGDDARVPFENGLWDEPRLQRSVKLVLPPTHTAHDARRHQLRSPEFARLTRQSASVNHISFLLPSCMQH